MGIKIFDVNIDNLIIDGKYYRFVKDGTSTILKDNFDYYRLDDGTYVIYGTEVYSGDSLTIPETFNGVSITRIGKEAFFGKYIQYLTIPYGITTIGEYAFYHCYGLKQVILPKSLQEVGDYSFYMDYNPDEMEDPRVQINVFYEGTEKEYYKIKFGSSWKFNCDITCYFYSEDEPTSEGNYWHYVNDVPVEWAKYTEYFTYEEYGTRYSISGVKNYIPLPSELEIPSKHNGKPVTRIKDKAFEDCTRIRGIIIPDSVTSIGEFAFSESSLTNITIPDSVTSINAGVFSQCKSLTSITIPDSVTYIGGSAFSNCSSLTSITIPDTVDFIDKYAFYNCSSLTFVYYKGDITKWDDITIEIANSPFKNDIIYYYSDIAPTTEGNYWHYDENDMPVAWKPYVEYFKYVENSTGYTVSGFKNGVKSPSKVEIPRTHNGKPVTAIANRAFWQLKSITSVTIPDSVVSIGYGSFWFCENITSIEVPDSVISIGAYAFAACSNLERVAIGDSVETIGDYVFAVCNKLTSIIVDENNQYYKSINGNLYSKDGKTLIRYAIGKADTLFEIPNGVTTIGDTAFIGCKSIVSVSIPNSVSYIGTTALAACPKLTNIIIDDNHPYYYVEAGCLIEKGTTKKVIFGSATTYIPNSASAIGTGAFHGGTYYAPIKIPLSITTIEPQAFVDCDNLVVLVEATEKPDGWDDNWNDGSVKVFWSCTEGAESCSHSFGDWTTVVQPNCLNSGISERRCSACGCVDRITLPATDHIYKTTVVDSTCLQRGYTLHKCEACGDTYRDRYISALGHDWDEGFMRVEPTCTENGVRRHICTRCGDFIEVGISALGHDWGEWYIIHPATCEIDGMRERKCSRYGETETEIIKATGHDWDVDVEIVEPTCTNGGYTIHKCNNCSETYWDNYTDPLGHNYVNGICTRCGESIKKGVVYYGASAIPERYNSEFILGLERQVPADAHLNSIGVRPLEDEYIYYCAPTSFGDCTFSYNNFVGGFTLIAEEVDLTYSAGLTRKYNIYKSNQANLGVNGAITITIEEKG